VKISIYKDVIEADSDFHIQTMVNVFDPPFDIIDKMNDWAVNNCSSYSKYEHLDITLFSTNYDSVCSFLFKEAPDANWFILRWS
jgi:hypothetical protein